MTTNYVTALGQKFLSPRVLKYIKAELVAFDEEYMLKQAKLIASTHPTAADELHKTAMIIRRIRYWLEDISEHKNVA